ncbi:streptomycin 6-kinase [Cognatiyoonia koreensis]|uniref:Streptomycin 6-kinase n=1 Tax=Cognatiyoonia koreensis TaxID=364200 RepID=A0A1I0PCB6_9RHOB|nr:aminoglycoside phosphotransferase family protein [Cognatiyoonia koreensis]SEW11999.1 streptomycin 6-kinase [Cognatiyoonia koreensis]
MHTVIKDWNLAQPILKAQTDIADIWQVTCADGKIAALKCYHNSDMKDEGPGFALLAAMKGQTAPVIYNQMNGAVLMEWLEGPTLGDRSRGGDDLGAGIALAAAAKAFHAQAGNAHVKLPLWVDQVSQLFSMRFAPECSDQLRAHITRASTIAVTLLRTQSEITQLHGDLHHDNIKMTARGAVAFDAKGLLGDPAYELSQALFNPLHSPDVYRPDRIESMSDISAAALDVSKRRLIGWGIVKCALTTVWTADGAVKEQTQPTIMGPLLDIWDREGN